jgi:hypothetical protein
MPGHFIQILGGLTVRAVPRSESSSSPPIVDRRDSDPLRLWDSAIRRQTAGRKFVRWPWFSNIARIRVAREVLKASELQQDIVA